MKRVIVICLMCVLGSCASTDSKNSANLVQTKHSRSGYDEQYMARVERQANQRGVVVKWVNPPKAPKAKKDGQ